MSYELLIYPKSYDAQSVRHHFTVRPNYTMFSGQAAYGNEDTGVGFTFDFSEGSSESEPAVFFNLSYFRSRVFGIEAAQELSIFLDAFDSRIVDPQQLESMGVGPYTSDGFLRSWNANNQFCFESFSGAKLERLIWPADPALVEAIWRWNLKREERQQRIGDRMFVPKVRWAVVDNGEPVSCVAWTEGVPTLIPRDLVTHVILVRQPRPSVKSMFGAIAGSGPKPEMKMVGLRAVAASHEVVETEFDGERIVQTPQATGIISTPGVWPRTSIRILPPEEICDSDLIDLMKKL